MLPNVTKSWIHTNLGGVVGSTEDEFWCAIVAGANVGDVGLILDKDLGAAKIAKLENTSAGIKKKVLRLDVTVTDALRMDISERAEELVDV